MITLILIQSLLKGEYKMAKITITIEDVEDNEVEVRSNTDVNKLDTPAQKLAMKLLKRVELEFGNS
jgi:hypothetical protein